MIFVLHNDKNLWDQRHESIDISKTSLPKMPHHQAQGPRDGYLLESEA